MEKSEREEKYRLNKAVALKYNKESESAPRVVAKGAGSVASRIRHMAEQSGIPIRRDDELVEFLAKIDLNQEIPVELYGAVAEILSWIYRANESMKKETDS